MKIQQKHYNELNEAIKSVIEYNGRDKVLKYHEDLKQCKDVNDARVRLMYDLMLLNTSPQWICDNLYPYCEDKHITTCLLKIGRELDILD